MSVLNQVLNDLEKRGAKPSLHEAVRAVPAPAKSARGVYIGAATILVGLAVGGAALYFPRGVQPVIAEKPPVVAVKTISAKTEIPAVSQVAAAQTIAIEPAAAVAAPLATNLESLEVTGGEQEVQGASAVPVTDVVLLPTLIQTPEAIIRKAPPASAIKVEKVLTLRQRAESELRKGRHLAKSGQAQEAVAAYESALRIDPTYFGARDILLSALLDGGRNAEAEQLLQEGLRQDKTQSRFAMLLARLQVERNELPLALETLEKTLPYAGQQADYRAFMAALLQRLERHAEAIVHYQFALQKSPDSGLWLMGMGISLQAVQRKEDARDAYNRALATSSLSPELHEFVTQQLKRL